VRAVGSPVRRIVATVMVFAVGLVAGCSGSPKAPASSTATTVPTTTTAGPAIGGMAEQLQQAFIAAVNRVRPSVVEISTRAGLGSGVVFDDRGDIVTNAHVVGTATSFQVSLSDGRTLPGALVGAYSPDDLAVIRVSASSLPAPAVLADSAAVQVGELVLAVGNPLGLSSSVTDGIVSFNGRTVSEGNGVVLPATIQTSAPINPGNSGGALVDLTGQVIGIPTLAASDTQDGGTAPGIGFAIPSNTVKLIAGQLAATGTVTSTGRAALGIRGATAVSASGAASGVIVVAVTAGGAADRAGVRAGDLVTAINGRTTPTLASLFDLLAGLKVGDTATVTVSRAGASRAISVVLEQQPSGT